MTFTLKSSEVSKSLVYSIDTDENGGRFENQLSLQELKSLIEHWYYDAVRVTVTSLRFSFENQILQAYSWSDSDMAMFNPTLTFKEAKVQSMRSVVIENPEEFYQAAYGSEIQVGTPKAVQSEANLGTALYSGASGAAVGAIVGSFISPGVGTAVGAVIGGAIGFFGNLFG